MVSALSVGVSLGLVLAARAVTLRAVVGTSSVTSGMHQQTPADIRDALREWTKLRSCGPRKGGCSAKPIMWVHIHKAGGSTMCHLAEKNGESVVEPQKNCNWADPAHGRSDDFNDCMNMTTRVTCQDRLAYFQQNGFTWGAIERELYPGSFCPEYFDYGIMLRDPVELFKSLVNFELPNYTDTMHCLANGKCPPITPGEKAENAWILGDNFVIRMLLGQEGVKIPVGGVSLEHYQTAVNILLKFKIVAFVEELDDPRTIEMFSSELGWRDGLGSTRENPTRHNVQFNEEELALLRHRTSWDKKLYNQFRQKMHQK